MSFWHHRNVLVTGATGLLGSWLCEELLARKANVVALVRDFVPQSRFFTEDIHLHVTQIKGSLQQFPVVERALNEYEIDTVFHLGAQTIVPTANRSPLSTFESNIRGTWTLLEAARRSPLVKQVVVASSDKAYGSHAQLPYTEEHPLQGRYPYDVSKSCVDLITQSYHHTYSLPVSITRCGNIYGGGDLNFSRIIPGTIKSIILGQRPVIRSDGSYIRDYFYVKDAALANMLVAEQLGQKSLHGHAFNFSIANKLSVLEVVNLIRGLMGTSLEPHILNEAKAEITHQYLSSGKAKQILGWEPSYTIEEGLKETIGWYQRHFQQ
ncbi:MAG TPA: GDP-mannose 4,6-dehydratase [Candidatus Nanoarchaeia archaeon]|nr:GDP-mannose 4,6-dehydratase [Candidatus Nanoarchaeia archaeon]